MSTPHSPIRVLLVDDHAVVRQGTRDLLQASPEIDVVAEAESGENLLGLIKLKQPDVVLLDINLPDRNGLELLQEIRGACPDLKVILFTAHTDLQYIRRGVSLKANGYLSKTITQADLQQAVIAVARNGDQPVYSPDVARKLETSAPPEDEPQLTPREYEILLQVAQGLTNRDIADALVLSVKTVDSHVAKLMKKIGVNNRAQLTAYAYEHGFL